MASFPMTVLPGNEIDTGRREQLLAAARATFAEKGYDGATVGDIVRAAGVAQGTFYLYFPSKRAVLVTLAREFRTALLAALFDPRLDALPPRDRARAMVRGVFDLSRRNPDLVRALHMGVDVDPADDLSAGEDARVVDRVTAFIRDGVDHSTLGPMKLEIVSAMICRLVERASLECFVFGDGSAAGQYEDTLVEMIDRVFRASESQPAEPGVDRSEGGGQ